MLQNLTLRKRMLRNLTLRKRMLRNLTLRKRTLRNAHFTEPHNTECACYGTSLYGMRMLRNLTLRSADQDPRGR